MFNYCKYAKWLLKELTFSALQKGAGDLCFLEPKSENQDINLLVIQTINIFTSSDNSSLLIADVAPPSELVSSNCSIGLVKEETT